MKEEDYIINISDLNNNLTVDIGDINYNHYDGTLSIYTGHSTWTTITLNDPVEFEDEMPSVAKVEDMCRDYPALEKAYENFKTVYKLVYQDWQGRQNEES